MTNIPDSSIEAVNAAIQRHNPFTNAGLAKEQDIWGKGSPDVPSLNTYASDTIYQAINFVSTSTSSQEKVTSIAITAQPGVGKTHLLARIRHKLQTESSALFVYSGVRNYLDLNLVKYQFQQTLANSLSNIGSQGVTQWQEVAAAMVNEGRGENSSSAAELVKKFDQAYTNSLANNKNLMNALQKQVLKNKPNADPYIIRAILWTLSETHATFAIRWLSGEELAQYNADALGLPNLSRTNQAREAEAPKSILQILNLVSYYNPVVICFDEIDSDNNSNDDGLPTEIVIANFVRFLHDTLANSEISRGVVMITVMLPFTWTHKINAIDNSGVPDRISKYTQRKPIDLQYINSDSMVELVTVWLQEFYQSKNLTPPHPLYPFEETQLREYGKGKPTVREALRWCANNFKVYEEPLPTDPLERFLLVLNREETDLGDFLEDNLLIAEALHFGLETLKSENLEDVVIENITSDIRPKSKNNNFINFKIIGNYQGQEFKMGVSVIQSPLYTLTAALKRLNDYETFDITCGCLVRSKVKIEQIRKNLEAYKLLNQLISEKGGKSVDLKEEEIRPLVAALAVYKKCSKYNLTEEQIFEFISQKRLTYENPLLREILSKPSGQVPAVDDEEDIQLIEGFINSSSMTATEDEDELTELFN
jgi:hypothetical protein